MLLNFIISHRWGQSMVYLFDYQICYWYVRKLRNLKSNFSHCRRKVESRLVGLVKYSKTFKRSMNIVILQLFVIQHMVTKIVDSRDSLLHKSLNAWQKLKSLDSKPRCNFGSQTPNRGSFCSSSVLRFVCTLSARSWTRWYASKITPADLRGHGRDPPG